MDTKVTTKSLFERDDVKWISVVGYESLYDVSNYGLVRRKTGYVSHSRGGKQILNGRVLKSTTCKSGYTTVALSKDGIAKTKFVHRLVMSAFNGNSNLIVDHINSKKSDNNLKNLRYCTQRDNICFSKTNPGVTINPTQYKKRYRVRIRINGNLKDFGSFMNLEDANIAYENIKSLQNQKICQTK